MKFHNGCWLLKEGYACFAPQQIYEYQITDNKVTICAPTHHIESRGATLGGINLTLAITSPAAGTLRVQTWHHAGFLAKSPSFDLELTEELPLATQDLPDKLIISSGNLSLHIYKENWLMEYRRDNKVISTSGSHDLALFKTDWRGDYYDKGDSENTYIRQQLSIGVDELIYGMGERFSPFVRNGQSVDIWNEDGGTGTEQSYKNIPFYLSNKGYGIFVNHPEKVSFEVATEQVTKSAFSVKGGYLDYYFIDGPSMKEVLVHYTDLTGKPSLPAPWTFGLWLSTSFTTNYDEETVMSFIDGMLDRQIPLRTFHFDCFWMKEFHWSDFLWDNRVFPDPKGMLERIKAKGLNVCVWINPYIGQESVLFKEGMEKGYFLKRANGDIWQWDMWQPGMALVDFTNPAACRWYQNKLEALLDMGVDCFKTDFGERIPTDCVYYDGSDPVKMHNYYTYLYNKTVYELLAKKRGKHDAFLFARSATVGGQKFPVHWGGDCNSNYESMAESLRGGLSLMMSGFGFWAHDIGGFESTSSADVYKRWVAFGLLSSHSRLHGSNSYRVPWMYDEESVDVVRFFTRLKAKLMPYIYKIAVDASKSGVPTMRSMVLEFPEDRTCHYLDRQYMLGGSILVAPVFREDGIVEYYLPKGRWTNFFTNEVKVGGRWITEQYDYFSLPLFVRQNSLIALGAHDNGPDYDYSDRAEIRLYELTEGFPVKTVVHTMTGKKGIFLTGLLKDNKIVLTSTANHTYCVRMINRKITSAKGAKFTIEGNDTILTHLTEYVELTLPAENEMLL